MILSMRQLHEGEQIPRGYGFAWRKETQQVWVFLPIPFNFIAAFCRWSWLCLQRGWQLPERTIDLTQMQRQAAFKDGVTYYREALLADLDGKPAPPLPSYFDARHPSS